MRTIRLRKLSLAMLVFGGAASALLIQHHSRVQQRSEMQTLLRQIDALTDTNGSLSNRLARLSQTRPSELPAREVVGVRPAAVVAPETLAATNLYALMTNNNAKLTVSQLDHYLESNQRNAASLLAAFRTTGEPELLAEAAQNYPDNAQVNFEAALRKDAPPGSGATELTLPQLVQTRELSEQMFALADSYRQNGDEISRQTVMEMMLNLGRRYEDSLPGEPLVSQLVGVALERKALAVMDPQATVDGSGQTAREQLDQLTQTRNAIQELAQKADPFWHAINDEDWISYHSRSLAFGERAALQWLVGKGAQP